MLVADDLQEEQKLLCRAATQHAHSSDSTALNHLLASGGWDTLSTLADSIATVSSASRSDTRQTKGGRADPGVTHTPTPQFGQMGIASPPRDSDTATAGGNAAGSSGTSQVECPHCTFVNEPGATDCEICGLPLAG